MWGVQIGATEFSDDFTQLQLILSHPVGENIQKHHFGGLLETKNDLSEVPGNAKWYEIKRKDGANPDKNLEEF